MKNPGLDELPTRHAYAALSLEQGNMEGVAQAYAEDVGVLPVLTCAHQHPDSQCPLQENTMSAWCG